MKLLVLSCLLRSLRGANAVAAKNDTPKHVLSVVTACTTSHDMMSHDDMTPPSVCHDTYVEVVY